jgi:hypothetical protein
MPPPGPCDASAALLHSAATAIEVATGIVRDIGARVRNDVMEISIQKALSKIRRQSTPGLARGKISSGGACRLRSSSWRIHSGPIQVAGVRLRAALRRAIRRRRGHPTQGEHSCSSRKFWDSPPLVRCWRSQLQPSAPMRCRSAIPAPPRRFRKMPGWRQRKCIGGITAITVGTIATIIIATGTAGERDSLAQMSHRPASLRACFRFCCCLETGEIAVRI